MVKIKLSVLILLAFGACKNNSHNTNQKEIPFAIMETVVDTPILVSSQLPVEVNEQSGLICDGDRFWVNNDSDCKPEIYAYNANGELVKTLVLSKEKNNDWEDLTYDSTFFYIGDFGNNYGSRKNLRILRLNRSEIIEDPSQEIEADELNFEWADQQNFTPRKQNHNYDCEAFFAYGDSLYLFTKNWADLKTRMYVMDKHTNHQILKVKDRLNSDLLITGADISRDGKMVALVGYKDFKTSLILLYDFKGSDFFKSKKLRFDLSVIGSAQTEGVAFNRHNQLFINTEETNQKQAIYRIAWEEYIK